MNFNLLKEVWFGEKVAYLSRMTTTDTFNYASITCNHQSVDSVLQDLIDKEFLDEIKNIVMSESEDIRLYFGKTLRDLKLVIKDETASREHEALIRYLAPNRLNLSYVNLPNSMLQNMEYFSLEEIILVIRNSLNDLAAYFYEMEHIDQVCTVMDPVKPTFRDDYRKILLDDRTWLHIEVTPEGLATNIHLIGQSEYWHDKLQAGLLTWDHDKDIVTNIMSIFDLSRFPQQFGKLNTQLTSDVVSALKTEGDVCGICLCVELPDVPGMPQPLCQYSSCGVYFHRSCLYQWLVACAGNRPPAFAVATGACPTCLQPISCSEKDT